MNARPVLLIDHDADWCARVCRFMEVHGITVVHATSLDAALEGFQQSGTPGAIVMDMAARRESGPAVSALRRNATFRDVPVGYVKKSAALDALLLMLSSSAAAASHHAA